MPRMQPACLGEESRAWPAMSVRSVALFLVAFFCPPVAVRQGCRERQQQGFGAGVPGGGSALPAAAHRRHRWLPAYFAFRRC